MKLDVWLVTFLPETTQQMNFNSNVLFFSLKVHTDEFADTSLMINKQMKINERNPICNSLCVYNFAHKIGLNLEPET